MRRIDNPRDRARYKNRLSELREEEVLITRKPKRSSKKFVSKEADPPVTDHAIIRYLERCAGVNVNEIREQMLAAGRVDIIQQVRTGKVPIGNGVKLVLRDGVVVSVVGREDEP